MMLNTVMPYYQTATKVSFTAIQADDGSIVRTYFDDGDIDVRVIAQPKNNATVYSKVELPLMTRLSSIRDRGGDEVMGDAVYQIQYATPVLNVLGFSDGYAYNAFLVDGS